MLFETVMANEPSVERACSIKATEYNNMAVDQSYT